jgi:hypothetical protein
MATAAQNEASNLTYVQELEAKVEILANRLHAVHKATSGRAPPLASRQDGSADTSMPHAPPAGSTASSSTSKAKAGAKRPASAASRRLQKKRKEASPKTAG